MNRRLKVLSRFPAEAPEKTRTDAQLMAQACVENRAAFKELHARHSSRVHAYLCRMLRDAALAEDLAQEAFMRLWIARETWDNSGTVAGYLIQVSRNLALNAQQSKQTRNRWMERQKNESHSSAPAPDVVLEQANLVARVDMAVEKLPGRVREVFVLKRDAGLSYNEIGTLLGISSRTVGAHLGNAYRLLRVALEDTRVVAER